jgi:nucleotide-binding universal stress UspA family protein
MQKTILVPLDGSRFAEQALPFALILARRLNARLELVLAWSPHPRDPDPSRPAEYLDGAAARIGTQLPQSVGRELLTVSASPMEYPPPPSNGVAEALAQHAHESEASLIVMTTHGHGGFRRAWLGSVADSLVRMASVPVLLIRPEDEVFGLAARADRGIRSILIPLDGTETAEAAINHALALGSPFGARHILLRVVSPLSWEVSSEAYDPHPADVSPLSLDAVAMELDRLADGMREQGHEVATRVESGTSPATVILDYAKEHDVDLIALGTAGAGPLRRLLLGSVSDKLIRGAEAPVLVCNARRTRAERATGQAAGESIDASPQAGI